jgi:hypothetical protein
MTTSRKYFLGHTKLLGSRESLYDSLEQEKAGMSDFTVASINHPLMPQGMYLSMLTGSTSASAGS